MKFRLQADLFNSNQSELNDLFFETWWSVSSAEALRMWKDETRKVAEQTALGLKAKKAHCPHIWRQARNINDELGTWKSQSLGVAFTNRDDRLETVSYMKHSLSAQEPDDFTGKILYLALTFSMFSKKISSKESKTN